MEWTLLHKRALIGGASRGIGRATAIELARLGADCVLMARNEENLKQVVSELRSGPNQHHEYLVVDYMDIADLQEQVRNAGERGRIDVLVNNTGGPPAGPIIAAKPDEFLEAFHQHLICNHMLTQEVIPGMIDEGFGRIVNVISTSVKTPLANLGVSNTIRAAVANWAKTLSNEVARYGITVNNVLPGATDTDRLRNIIHGKAKKQETEEADVVRKMQQEIPMNRFAKPSEIGAAIAFLASPAASYITGINLPVDGGRTKTL